MRNFIYLVSFMNSQGNVTENLIQKPFPAASCETPAFKSESNNIVLIRLCGPLHKLRVHFTEAYPYTYKGNFACFLSSAVFMYIFSKHITGMPSLSNCLNQDQA